jgi:hypothetical protein
MLWGNFLMALAQVQAPTYLPGFEPSDATIFAHNYAHAH